MKQLDLFPETLNDDVNSPAHYTSGGIETIEYIRAKLSPDEYRGYLRGNALKYLMRMGSKGPALQDAQKAMHYTEMLVRSLQKQGETT